MERSGRLFELEILRARGVLTAEAYERARARILAGESWPGAEASPALRRAVETVRREVAVARLDAEWAEESGAGGRLRPPQRCFGATGAALVAFGGTVKVLAARLSEVPGSPGGCIITGDPPQPGFGEAVILPLLPPGLLLIAAGIVAEGAIRARRRRRTEAEYRTRRAALLAGRAAESAGT